MYDKTTKEYSLLELQTAADSTIVSNADGFVTTTANYQAGEEFYGDVSAFAGKDVVVILQVARHLPGSFDPEGENFVNTFYSGIVQNLGFVENK